MKKFIDVRKRVLKKIELFRTWQRRSPHAGEEPMKKRQYRVLEEILDRKELPVARQTGVVR